jgi:hypothetical protein
MAPRYRSGCGTWTWWSHSGSEPIV